VRNAITEHWSNGQVEGQINRLLNEPCMAELGPSFYTPGCYLYNARQLQTLRQNPSKASAN